MTGTRKTGLRVLCLALSMISLLCMVQPVFAVQTDDAAAQTVTAIVRNGTSGRSDPIGQMENGTKLNILDEKGDYYKIDCYNMTGYLLKSQVEPRDGEYYVNCQEGDPNTGKITYTDHQDVLTMRERIYSLAKEQLGTRYRYGGASPSGFDCSGFTSYVLKSLGFSMHRTASTQLPDGVIIPTEALQIGDLVFFKKTGNSHPATHVGIYIGDNKMIHSARHGVVVESLDSPYYAKYYLCARRVLHVSPLENVQPVAAARSVQPALQVNSITGRTAQCCE